MPLHLAPRGALDARHALAGSILNEVELRLVPLTIGAVLAAYAQQEPGFSFADIHLHSELTQVATRYPHSTRVGDYIYVAFQDSHDHIFGVELSGAGPTRRLRVSFERPADAPGPRAAARYPRCATVQRGLEARYGPPTALSEFSEEASRRSDRIWRRGGETLRLICFHPPGRQAPLLAEAVLIVPSGDR